MARTSSHAALGEEFEGRGQVLDLVGPAVPLVLRGQRNDSNDEDGQEQRDVLGDDGAQDRPARSRHSVVLLGHWSLEARRSPQRRLDLSAVARPPESRFPLTSETL
jgi:hypothetical protein